MAIEIVEIHHHAIRIDSDRPKLDATRDFYENVLGMKADPGRPTIPGVPGFWINTGGACRVSSFESCARPGIESICHPPITQGRFRLSLNGETISVMRL